MKQKRSTESQIVSILKESEGGISISDLCRKYGISSSAFYSWRSKYGGMDVSMLTKPQFGVILVHRNSSLSNNFSRSNNPSRHASHKMGKSIHRRSVSCMPKH